MTSPTPTAPPDPNKLMQSVKAIAAAVVTFAGALALVMADPKTSALLPETWAQWITSGAAAVIAFGAVFGLRNARTVEQAQADLDRALARERRGPLRPLPDRIFPDAAPIVHPSAPHPAAANPPRIVDAELPDVDDDDEPGRHERA